MNHTAQTMDGAEPVVAGQRPAPVGEHATRRPAMAKPATARTPGPRNPVTVEFDHDPELPPLIQAAALALAVLAWTKAGSITTLADRLTAGDPTTTRLAAAIRLTPGQAALLDDPTHTGPLQHLRATSGTGAGVTVQLCPECGRWSVSFRGSSRACRMTAHCPGEVIRAGRARRKPGGTAPGPPTPTRADGP